MADHLVSIGGITVGRYPDSTWQPMPTEVKLNDVWRLCGPTVQRHTSRELPLWKIFCAVYYEGIVHGMQTTLRMQDDGKLPMHEQPLPMDAL